jgi:uncharacterized protein (DUF697 family)
MMNKKKLPKAIRPVDAGWTEPVQVAPESPPTRPGTVRPSASATASLDAAEAPATDRRAVASRLVKRFSLWSGAAGVIPLPFVDLAAVGGLQIQMLRRISQIYSVPFSENRGKALIASLAGAMIPATSVIGAASMSKGVPVIGTAVSVIGMPALSAGATYGIGMAFIQHFASGGTLLDFSPSDYREFLKAQKEPRNLRARAATKVSA